MSKKKPNDLNQNVGGDGTGGPGGSGSTSIEITVSGNDVNSATVGTVYPVGTSYDAILTDMLGLPIPPTYFAPSLSLSGSGSEDVEAGTILNPQLSATFNQNDAGAAQDLRIYKQGGLVATNSNPYTDPAFQIGDENISYYAEQDHAEGPTKNNNQGTPDPTGKILATPPPVTSNTVTYRGLRNAFYDDSLPAGNSAEVRALTNTLLNPSNGSQFTIDIPINADRVVFAYPASLQDVSSVLYVELSNLDVKGTFGAPTLINVEGANGHTAIQYKVYEFIPAVPFSTAATYIVTI